MDEYITIRIIAINFSVSTSFMPLHLSHISRSRITGTPIGRPINKKQETMNLVIMF